MPGRWGGARKADDLFAGRRLAQDYCKAFLSKVVAAEVAAAALTDRANEVSGVTVRVWLGLCEGEAEATLQVSDSAPSVGFGATPAGETVVPSVEALSELWHNQVTGAAFSTPMHTASEGAATGLVERLSALERSVQVWRLLCLKPGQRLM